MQAKQLLRRERERQQKGREEAERRRILENRGNPEEVFLRRRRMEQFQDKLEEYKKRQKERKLDIVAKLLKEDRATKQVGHLQLPTVLSSAKKRRKRRGTRPPPPLLQEVAPGDHQVEPKSLDSDLSEDEDEESISLNTKNIKIIIEPEIKGLWEKQTPTTEPGGGGGGSGGGGDSGGAVEEKSSFVRSKAEEKMMKEAMTKLRKNIIVKQMAAGKEFKV